MCSVAPPEGASMEFAMKRPCVSCAAMIQATVVWAALVVLVCLIRPYGSHWFSERIIIILLNVVAVLIGAMTAVVCFFWRRWRDEIAEARHH